MGKNQKHKKKLKSEKAKIQLVKKTKTKFLPKGQNVTNTSFKVRSIVLPEQLKEKQLDIGGKRNFNIPDLIGKLKHYNTSIKINACEEFLELFKNHSFNSIDIYFSGLMQNGCVLIQDRDKKVRKAFLKLINVIFEKVSLEVLMPFSHYFISNLKCAMTNIDCNIQEDSLLFLDSLQNNYATVLALNYRKILPDFLTLISKLKNDNLNSNNNRMLIINFGSKLTTINWRIKVLCRLYGILEAIVKNEQLKNDEMKSEVLEFSGNSYYLSLDSIEFTDDTFLRLSDDNDDNFSCDNLMTLMPLLSDIWLECVPEKSRKIGNFEPISLNEESSNLFICVVHILYLLYEYVKINEQNNGKLKSVISSQAYNKFLELLMKNFPYSQQFRKSKDNFLESQLKRNFDVKCIEENLLICFLFLCSGVNLGQNVKSLEKISNFLNKILIMSHINTSNVKYFCLILKKIVTGKKLERYIRIDEILENITKMCNSGKLTDECKSTILQLLTEFKPI